MWRNIIYVFSGIINFMETWRRYTSSQWCDHQQSSMYIVERTLQKRRKKGGVMAHHGLYPKGKASYTFFFMSMIIQQRKPKQPTPTPTPPQKKKISKFYFTENANCITQIYLTPCHLIFWLSSKRLDNKIKKMLCIDVGKPYISMRLPI